jgi:hypothetical protein
MITKKNGEVVPCGKCYKKNGYCKKCCGTLINLKKNVACKKCNKGKIKKSKSSSSSSSD